MPAKKVKKSEGLRRTHVKDRPAITPNQKSPKKQSTSGSKKAGTVAQARSNPIAVITGSRTPEEYGKPNCLADII